MARGPNRRE